MITDSRIRDLGLQIKESRNSVLQDGF